MKRTCNNSIARKNHLQAIVMGKYASRRSPVGLYYASYARNTFPMIMRRWGFITRRLRAYFMRGTRDEFGALSHLDNSEINWFIPDTHIGYNWNFEWFLQLKLKFYDRFSINAGLANRAICSSTNGF